MKKLLLALFTLASVLGTSCKKERLAEPKDNLPKITDKKSSENPVNSVVDYNDHDHTVSHAAIPKVCSGYDPSTSSQGKCTPY